MLFLSLFFTSGLLLQGFKLLFRYLISRIYDYYQEPRTFDIQSLETIGKNSSSKVKIAGKVLRSYNFYPSYLRQRRSMATSAGPNIRNQKLINI